MPDALLIGGSTCVRNGSSKKGGYVIYIIKNHPNLNIDLIITSLYFVIMKIWRNYVHAVLGT